MQGDLIGWYSVGRDGLGERCGESGQCWLFEQLTDRERITGPAQTFEQGNRQQGMAAQCEEMILTTDVVDAEQVLPESSQKLFALTLWGFVFGAHHIVLSGLRQGLAIDLTIRR